jgi:hypothetical protein
VKEFTWRGHPLHLPVAPATNDNSGKYTTDLGMRRTQRQPDRPRQEQDLRRKISAAVGLGYMPTDHAKHAA